MLSLGSERLHKQIEDALSGRDASRKIGWRLYLDGEDYSERLKEGGYVHEDGPAARLDIDVAGMLSEALEGKEAVLEWHVEGIPVWGFTGTMFDVRTGSISTVEAASPGTWTERTELGERIEYGGANPSTAMNDALLRVAGYTQVRVATVEEPKFIRQGPEAYSATDTAGNVVEAVQSEVPAFVLYDTADGGCSAFVEPSLADMPGPVWTFEVGKDVDREDFEDGREADLYREVGVRRAKVNPEPGIDPWEVLRRVEVAGSRAPLGTIRWIDVSDTATDLEPFFRLAHQEAQAQTYRIGRISWVPSYVHPLLERGDAVAVIRPGKDELGEYRERWLCVLDKADCPEVRRKRGSYAGDGRVIETVRVERGPEPLAGITPGVVSYEVLLGEYGWGTYSFETQGRFWINPAKLEGENEYAGVEAGRFWIDEEISDEKAGVDSVTGRLWLEDTNG